MALGLGFAAVVLACGNSRLGDSGCSDDDCAGGRAASSGAGSGGDTAGGGGGASGSAGAGATCPGASGPAIGGCRTSADCQIGSCIWPGETVFPCDPQCPSPCVESQCGPTGVCAPVPATAPSCCRGRMTCVVRCTADSCAGDEICGTEGYCYAVPCNAGWTCAADELCLLGASDADAHGCAPAKCSDGGYTCPTGQHCDSGTGSDAHGCRYFCSEVGCPPNQTCSSDLSCHPKTCARDEDCDCGVCGNGTCRNQLGTCASPI
jgi:hypothetical protein